MNFERLYASLKVLFCENKGRKDCHFESGFKVLVLQWMKNLSDRELEHFLRENVSEKFFCGFSLLENTPDHTYFSHLRSKIGTKRLAELFRKFNVQLKAQGLIAAEFSFVDASQILSKTNLWKERDEAVEKGFKFFNNKTAKKVATDKQARVGCKGKSKFWYGHKRNVAVCMKLGLITKVAVTPANITDDQ